MFSVNHFAKVWPILRKLDLKQPKAFTEGDFDVRIFGYLREPNSAFYDEGFGMVSYFGDTPFLVKGGGFAKSALKTRITTSLIWSAVGIKTR